MKYSAYLLLSIILVGISAPATSFALSCLDPASSIDYHATDADYTVVTAKAGEATEYVQNKATGEQPFMNDSGYTGQYITVSESHRGGMDSQAFVYFQKNETWGYMCTNQPPAAGVESIYVLTKDNSPFGLTRVVQVYSLDSEYATDLLAALELDGATGEVFARTAASWQSGLAGNLREMVFFIRLKLNEWRLWKAL
jgi:hypothetical protein